MGDLPNDWKVNEVELTEPVALLKPDGRFNRAAHGWARQPIVDTSGVDGTTFAPKNRRWEYWCVLTPTHILAFSMANIDYYAPVSVWMFDRRTKQEVSHTGIAPAAGGPTTYVDLPANVESGPATARIGPLSVDIEQVDGGSRIKVVIPDGSFEVFARRPAGHERLAVVVPWDDVLVQYTVKDTSRPAEGTVTMNGETSPIPAGESWAILDHGRGRWPADVHWNWGAGSGHAVDGRVIGIQFGDKWTDGTGSTENSFLLGTKLYKISTKLKWEYDTDDYLKPWHVSGGGLDATLTTFHNKSSRVKTEKVTNDTDQVFGTWTGTFHTGDEVVEFKDIIGFAEDVTRTW